MSDDGRDAHRPTRRAVLAATAAAGLLAGCEQPPEDGFGDGTPTPRFGYGGTPTTGGADTPTETTDSGDTPTRTPTGNDTPAGTPDTGDTPTGTQTGGATPAGTPLPESVDDYGEQRYGRFGYGGVPAGGAR